MDISTKFSVGDICMFLMADEDDCTDIRVVEAEIERIKFECTEYGTELLYVVKDENRKKIELPEEILCKNHREIVQHLFNSKNVRTFMNPNHKTSIKKESTIDMETLLGAMHHYPNNPVVNMDELFRQFIREGEG